MEIPYRDLIYVYPAIMIIYKNKILSFRKAFKLQNNHEILNTIVNTSHYCYSCMYNSLNYLRTLKVSKLHNTYS